MSDKPTPGTVPMTGPYVKQKHRLAAVFDASGHLSPWRLSGEALLQMASSQLRYDFGTRRRPGNGTSEATGIPDAKAAAGRHAERRCGGRGDLRRRLPHSAWLGGDLWPGRHDGRHAETCPSCGPGPAAPRLENECPVASRRQRQRRSVVQPVSQWRRHSPATPAGKGRHRIRCQQPPGPGAKSLAGLTWCSSRSARSVR